MNGFVRRGQKQIASFFQKHVPSSKVENKFMPKIILKVWQIYLIRVS